MKRFRIFFLPTACFVLAWTIAHLSTGTAERPKPSPVITTIHPPATPASRGSNNATVQALVAAFDKAPMSEWAALWDAFADKADAADFAALSALFNSDPKPAYGQRGGGVLLRLTAEELAVRTRRPAFSPGAYAALAESDPDAAWEMLLKNNHEALSCAVLRTLAQRDPADALRRWHSLPAGVERKYDTGDRGSVYHSPLGSLFASWARFDPIAAAAAAAAESPSTGRDNVAGEVAMAWVFRDPVAGLRYIARSLDEKKPQSQGRMDVMLRAALQAAPAETAKLLTELPVLRQGMASWRADTAAHTLWYAADPEGMTAWLRETGKGADWWLISWAIKTDPIAGAHLLRMFPKSVTPDQSPYIARIAERDPALAATLADEFGIRPQVQALLAAAEAKADPAAACDRWLAALREHGAADALAALGWTPDLARELAGFATTVFPDKAAELAKLIPASQLALPDGRYMGDGFARFWPEFAQKPEPAPTTPVKYFPAEQFALDPAGTAETLLARGLEEWDAWNAVSHWAPFDIAAARTWLARVPEGRARQLGELALAREQISAEPAAVLEKLSSWSFAEPRLIQDGARMWASSLQRLALTGGDWRPWLTRLPDAFSNNFLFVANKLEHELEAEASLLATLQKTASH